MSKILSAVSLFSGCGGFDYGSHQSGIEIIWANDLDKHAAAAYRSILPNVEFHERDIREIKSFPQADILIGCYPCTGFSLAARRRWKDREARDLRMNDDNFLYREFVRALIQVKPKFIFIENVGGMISAQEGWFFEQQLEGFRKHGYNLYHDVLYAPDFGVPQSRKRMFIVGVHQAFSSFRYSFPKPTHGPSTSKPYQVLRDAIGDMELWPDGEYFSASFHGHYLTRNRKRSWADLSYTIVANAHHIPLHPMGEPMKYVSKDKWDLQGHANRRLSWRESVRIQGLPDTILPSGNLTHKYRVIGNAVPPALGKAIVKSIVELSNCSTSSVPEPDFDIC